MVLLAALICLCLVQVAIGLSFSYTESFIYDAPDHVNHVKSESNKNAAWIEGKSMNLFDIAEKERDYFHIRGSYSKSDSPRVLSRQLQELSGLSPCSGSFPNPSRVPSPVPTTKPSAEPKKKPHPKMKSTQKPSVVALNAR